MSMLDDYREEQPIIHKILMNSVKKNKYSHAYLFELNGYSKGFDMALAFAKFLLCPNNYSSKDFCKNCSQCRNIDLNNFLEIEIINPDGQWIKKEQLEDLQKKFIKKSLLGNKKVYIINHAEKLNTSASNSLLKFLEEPPEGIIAILVTNNMYQLLNTIISRCQILSLKKEQIKLSTINSLEKIGKYLYNDNENYNEFISSIGKVYVEKIVDYVSSIEKLKKEAILFDNKKFLEIFNERKKINIAFEILILYYKDVLNYILDSNIQFFEDYSESIKQVADNNTVLSLTKKIKILVDLNQNIKYNLNVNLLMDKLVIELSEV